MKVITIIAIAVIAVVFMGFSCFMIWVFAICGEELDKCRQLRDEIREEKA